MKGLKRHISEILLRRLQLISLALLLTTSPVYARVAALWHAKKAGDIVVTLVFFAIFWGVMYLIVYVVNRAQQAAAARHVQISFWPWIFTFISGTLFAAYLYCKGWRLVLLDPISRGWSHLSPEHITGIILGVITCIGVLSCILVRIRRK